MELLRLFDRTLTRFLQALSQKLERKYMSIYMQRTVIWLTIDLLLVQLILKDSAFEPWYSIIYAIILGALLLIILCLAALPLANILYRLDLFFDPDQARQGDKLYSSGYSAWAWVIFGTAFIFLTMLLRSSWFGTACMYNVATAFADEAYIRFLNRKHGNKAKKKGVVTEAMQKLLQACSSWLPVPVPNLG